MRYRKPISLAAAGLLLFGAAACADLEVTNLNDPDTERVLATPGDIESLIAGGYTNWWYATHDYDGVAMALMTAAEEVSSSWGNAGMREMSSLPRIAWPNQVSWGYADVLEDSWYNPYRALRAVYDGLSAVDGGVELENEAAARAFAKFIQGISLGHLAATYDQAYILTEEVEPDANGKLVLALQPYPVVMDAALAALDEAIEFSNSGSFTLPSPWVNGVTVDNGMLARLAHSYAARYMAWEARTPEERQNADWNAIIAHVDQGITEDFGPFGDGAPPWSGSVWYEESDIYLGLAGWGRADLQGIGVADVSGAYSNWMATAPEQRKPFEIVTPDRRITAEGDPTAAGKYYDYLTSIPFRTERGTYHFSNYWRGHGMEYRYLDRLEGQMVDMSLAEMRLLEAEGLYYGGEANYDEVAAIINETRVANGELPPVTADGLPSSDPDSCVPKKMHTTTRECGDLFDALKWELRVETAQTATSTWYFNGRGWGDLVEGTPLQAPVPERELQVIEAPTYTFGGVGGTCAAGSATGCNPSGG